MVLEAIKYQRGYLEILDQLLLPDTIHYIAVNDTEDGWQAIKKMQVRGAPAIAIVGCLSLAVELHESRVIDSKSKLEAFVIERLNYLVSARPTAVNMADSAARFKSFTKKLIAGTDEPIEDIIVSIIEELETLLESDIATNKKIGQHGGRYILGQSDGSGVSILTHCNTGSLATAGYGTALGVIRYLHEHNKLKEVYCTETRPYNQGSRLTAFELVHEKMNATLICDSMCAILMKKKDISAVVVGADRVVSNGDTANKVGTFQLAIVAKHFNVPFYVACPLTTYDGTEHNGHDIEIEERPGHEMTTIRGVPIAAEGIECWNPAFDITPADLITGGIITEHGVFQPETLSQRLEELNLV